MRHKPPPEAQGIEYVLRTIPPGGDLDLYVFTDLQHAREWLRQPFVSDAEWAITIAHIRYGKRACAHCGHRKTYWLRHQTLPPSVFCAAQGEDAPPQEATMPTHYEPNPDWVLEAISCCQHCGCLPEGHHTDGRCYSVAEMGARLRWAQQTGRWPGPDEDVTAPPGGPTVPL